MATLRVDTYAMPSASMGEDNPLPDLSRTMDTHATIEIDSETVSPEESRYMGYARPYGVLPYTMRDGYDRNRTQRTWKAIVLENAHLRATFLPEMGGRLWSLIDLSKGRELLHRNPVFQPCNLALRNAWVSGGVEWNMGMVGHSPFTVDTVFTESITLSDGTPVLRMYQYERVRNITYRVEAALPEDSHHLLVRVRMDNAGDQDTATYWWSNIAVDERPDVRVIVPAKRAFRYSYGEKLRKVPVPRPDDIDITYSTNLETAVDYFYDIDPAQRRFIAALSGDGYGLCQSSTDRLIGRKLFVWGMGDGGRNWQSFLSEPGEQYLEIQAGIAHTQLEHLPMAAGETITWTEAYGPLQADSDITHADDYDAACACAERALSASLPRETLDAFHARLSAELDGATGTPITMGDGFGALQAALHGDSFHTNGLSFPESTIGDAEMPWLALLQTGALPCPDPLDVPRSYQVDDAWRERVEASIASGKGDHWFAQYHLGVMRAYQKDTAGAMAAFMASLSRARSPWALRCMAVIKGQMEDHDGAADCMVEALSMKPQRHIALETLIALRNSGRYEKLLATADQLPAAIRSLGRVDMMRIAALIGLSRFDEAEALLRGDIVVADMREGEASLTDLWYSLVEKKGLSKEDNPPPKHLDYRMHP